MDFEFAGFFPNEEFTNNAIANSDDWPEAAYRVFLEELEGLRERTPLRRIDQGLWKEACRHVQITEDVAPWYLREGDTKAGIGGRTKQSFRENQFGIAQFGVEVVRKRRKNEREQGQK